MLIHATMVGGACPFDGHAASSRAAVPLREAAVGFVSCSEPGDLQISLHPALQLPRRVSLSSRVLGLRTGSDLGPHSLVGVHHWP